ncbi:unnamed protein product [Owenia fusiformis]|uniref:Uncharacterized protein n=1 Tax=Owenia fusiformis TaxID=6347 RepID=A0A8S4PTR2_OWEFU|nr:unnamed protein product [Owenia fusiformis]
MHDNNYGQITHIDESFDGKYLFSVGADGNIFSFNVMDQASVEDRVKESKAKIPSARKAVEEKRVEDIEDPSAYSIEDAKQKAEHDKMMRLAEEKKTDVKRTIAQLRRQFKKLIERNVELPAHLRLDRKEFEMDPEIKKELERQTQEKKDITRKELSWEKEKHRIALEKLKARFKDVVECERIVLKAFKTSHEVTSFRASKLSDDFYELKAEMERRKTTMLTNKGDMSREHSQLTGQQLQQSKNVDSPDGIKEEKTEAKIFTSLKGSMGERISKALIKVEEKKKKRQQRRDQWNDLNNTKPDEDYEDPADIAAIKEAQENMGDYKLKSADDYVVPDHLRMNAEKARNKLLLVKDLIHRHKYDFNQRLLKLRDKKLGIIDEIREIVGKLEDMQNNLEEDQRIAVPEVPRMYPEEVPEKRFEYTRDQLLAYKAEQTQANNAAQSGFGGGFGGGGAKKPSSPGPYKKQDTNLTGVDRGDTTLTQGTEDMGEREVKLTPLEIQIKMAQEIRNLYERDRMMSQINELLENFDAELRLLRHDKFRLDVDLKNADLRHVTLFEELILLKEFEKRENLLTEKQDNKEQEKIDMQVKIMEVQQKLDMKRRDIEKLQEKERMLHSTFLMSLGENNKFGDYLTKVFKKRIKRSKKKDTEGDGSDEDSDDDSDDESDWSESDEESDSEAGGFDLDVCPPGCDQTLYDNTCALREKRLDIEEALAEEKKNNEALKKESEALQKKAKVIDGALKNALGELEAFQLEKQRKLNELDVVVTLRLHQIQHMVNGVLPQDLSSCLVFDESGLVRLQHRIKELEHEKAMQKKQQKEAKKKHISLIKDRRLFQSKITEMEEQCDQMMMLKFGRIVDLEKLETVTVNRNIEELKEKLRQNEIFCSNDVQKWMEKIKAKKNHITELIRENTNRLEQLTMLLGEKRELESGLDSRQKSLLAIKDQGGEFSGQRKADLRERQRLIQLVQLQAQEVEALKEEIMLLSRKGGHILPPAQPPAPSAPRSNMPQQ